MLRKTMIAGVAAGAVVMSGCSATEATSEATFDWRGTTLKVVNDNHSMPVSVEAGRTHQVRVSVTTTTVGKSANEPEWRLDGDELDLDSPCTKGYVGTCEGSYVVVVPKGVKVLVNGDEVPVG